MYCLYTRPALCCSGYIEVKWHKVMKDSEAAIDTDGDGKVTTSDIAEWGNRLLTVAFQKRLETAFSRKRVFRGA